MSIIGRHREPAPEWQSEFETREEWTAFVKERFLSGLRPGEPFLLVTHVREHDSTGRTTPPTWLQPNYWIGVLGDEEPLVSHDTVTSGVHWPYVRIAAKRFVCHPDTCRNRKLTDIVEGPALIAHNSFNYTPVTKSFGAPFRIEQSFSIYGEQIEAFSAACGIEEMEKLAIKQSARFRHFLGWYARTVERLGLPVSDEHIQEERRKWWCFIIRRLRENHARIVHLTKNIKRVQNSVGQVQMSDGALTIITDEVFAGILSYGDRKDAEECREAIKGHISDADAIGLSANFDLLYVDGFRCQPAIVIEDFRRLYLTPRE